MSPVRGTAPAFQLYAFDLLAKRTFRLMSFAERGLLLSMWCECWANMDIPSNPTDLGSILGKPGMERILTERVKGFFVEVDGYFRSPDLETYRKKVLEQRRRMSEGGSKGGRRRAERERKDSNHRSSLPSMIDQATFKGRESGPESEFESETENASIGTSVKTQSDDKWLKDYEDASSGV